MKKEILEYLNININKIERQNASTSVLLIRSKFKVDREYAKDVYYEWKRAYMSAKACVPSDELEVSDFFISGIWTKEEDEFLRVHRSYSKCFLMSKLKRSEKSITKRLEKVRKDILNGDCYFNDEEKNDLFKLRSKGESFKNIAKEIGKSEGECSLQYIEIVKDKLRKGVL
ncbi:MAG: hypothetical protein ACRDCB_06030 [Clostridium sp.]|uniref:hypothetical protein n=1 Tax=Clostridium sp. TaxID=1506 RepID=UPI003EE4EE40